MYGCKDNDKLTQAPEDGLSIQSAKNIYNANKQLYTGEPDWDNAYYYNGIKDILKVPLESNEGIRELIFEKNKDGLVKKYILLSFPDSEYWINKINSYPHSNISFSDYTGSSLKFETNGDFIDGYYYEKGKALNEFKINKANQAKVKSDDVDCTNPKGPWIVYCATNGLLGGVTISAPGNNSAGAGIIPLVGGGGPNGGYSLYISNKLTTPCIVDAFNKMRAAQFNNAVQNILKNFNQSANLAFTIQDFSISQYPQENAYTDVSAKSITLNNFALANASQEFITKSIYHEILHIYLNVSEISDHNIMAKNYVSPIASALMIQYPKLSKEDAASLAWSGLYDSKAWNKLDPGTQKKIVDTNAQFKNLNNQYNHQYGTPCK